jgi:SAM-dependent methyltransferase
MRINLGCGMSPTVGWENFDNSLSVRLGSHPGLARILHNLGALDSPQFEYVEFCARNNIRFADATRRIPVASGAVEVIYSSHMVEHLDKAGSVKFLAEARRVLKPGGILRVVVPDIRKIVESYISIGDADCFIESTLLCVPAPSGMLRRITTALVGPRHHQWMYDGASLCKLLGSNGFSDARVVPAGETIIPSPEPLNLREREGESVYVEAVRP